MAVHPSINEEAKGFWGGYYKGLGYILWGCIILINIIVTSRIIWNHDLREIPSALILWYSSAHDSFFIAQGILFALGILSYIVSLYINKVTHKKKFHL